jgi:hypothetical protein
VKIIVLIVIDNHLSLHYYYSVDHFSIDDVSKRPRGYLRARAELLVVMKLNLKKPQKTIILIKIPIGF